MNFKRILTVVGFVSIGIIILVSIGSMIYFTTETKAMTTEINKHSSQRHKQNQIIQKNWSYQPAQAASTGFFTIYHTFKDQASYNERANLAQRYATKAITTDDKLFTSDVSYGDSYINTSKLRFQAGNVVFYPEVTKGNKQLGKVSVVVESQFGDNAKGALMTWYDVQFDTKQNLITDVKFIGKQEVEQDSDIPGANKQN